MADLRLSRHAEETFHEFSEDCSDDIDVEQLRAFADLVSESKSDADRNKRRRMRLHHPSINTFALLLGMILIGIFFGFVINQSAENSTIGMAVMSLSNLSQIQIGVGILTTALLISLGLFGLLLKMIK